MKTNGLVCCAAAHFLLAAQFVLGPRIRAQEIQAIGAAAGAAVLATDVAAELAASTADLAATNLAATNLAATNLAATNLATADGDYDGDSCCCGAVPFWYAGVEATFLGFDATTGGQATLSFNDSDTAGVDAQFVGSQGVQDAFAVAPRLWVGRQITDKWGVVARFWYLSQSKETPALSPPGVVNLTNFLTTSDVSRAQLYTVDLEAVRSFRPGRWKIDGLGGVRYGSLNTNSRLSTFGVFTPGNFVNLSLGNGVRFDGTGLTGGVIARRQIGDSPMSLFIAGRGSVLWGHTDSFAQVAGTIAAPPSAPLVGAATVTRQDGEATARIGELQVGAQWDFELRRVPMNAFFRVAFEYQHWNVDGLPTGGAGFGGTLGDLTTNSFVSANATPDANLLGASIATGFMW